MGCHFVAVCEVVADLPAASQDDCAIQAALGGFPRPSCRGVPAMSAYVSNLSVSLLLAIFCQGGR